MPEDDAGDDEAAIAHEGIADLDHGGDAQDFGAQMVGVVVAAEDEPGGDADGFGGEADGEDEGEIDTQVFCAHGVRGVEDDKDETQEKGEDGAGAVGDVKDGGEVQCRADDEDDGEDGKGGAVEEGGRRGSGHGMRVAERLSGDNGNLWFFAVEGMRSGFLNKMNRICGEMNEMGNF